MHMEDGPSCIDPLVNLPAFEIQLRPAFRPTLVPHLLIENGPDLDDEQLATRLSTPDERGSFEFVGLHKFLTELLHAFRCENYLFDRWRFGVEICIIIRGRSGLTHD